MVDLSIVMLVYQRVPQPQSTDRIPAAKLNNSVRGKTTSHQDFLGAVQEQDYQ